MRKFLIGVYIIFIVLFALFLNFHYIVGNSMSPTYSDGSFLVSYKRFDKNSLKRFQVISFKKVDYCSGSLLKRIVGLPGDSIQILDNHLYINGTEMWDEHFHGDLDSVDINISVPSDKVFVLGDNLNESIDSRYAQIGFVDFSEIGGVVLW